MKRLKSILPLTVFAVVLFTACEKTNHYRVCSECSTQSNSDAIPVDTNAEKDGKPDLYLKCNNPTLHSTPYLCGEEVVFVYDSASQKLLIDGNFQGSVCPIYSGNFCKSCPQKRDDD